jgi:DNA modification methylase
VIYTGDCIEVMRTMPADSVDAVVTDPPYNLSFMGKGWDTFPTRKRGMGGTGYKSEWAGGVEFPSKVADLHQFQAWCEQWGREALRVTKPGGYLLAFGGTRTHHRLVCGLEDAGWIIRDELDWIYACLSDDTEILTSEGWRPYNGVSTNDTVLAFDSAAGKLQWEPVKAVHRYTHEGEMVRLVGDGTDQLVTLNHRLVLVDGQGVADLPGVRGDVLAARGMAASGVQGTVVLEAMQRDQAYPRSALSTGDESGLDRGLVGVLSREHGRSEQPSMAGRRYRLSEARQLLRRSVRSGTGLGDADGSQGWVHHGAPATDGGPVRLPDDQDGSGQSREPRPDRQPPREPDALAHESGPQAVRVVEAGDAWSLVPTGPVSASLVDYAGMVWCITVPSGAFVARRRGVAFVTGNSGFPKGKANLKPAHEPIVLARKPGPLRPLGIDECRIETTDDLNGGAYTEGRDPRLMRPGGGETQAQPKGPFVQPSGRWPSNVLLSSPELFDQPNPYVVGSGATVDAQRSVRVRAGSVIGNGNTHGEFVSNRDSVGGYDDSGGYSRFFALSTTMDGRCQYCGVVNAESSSSVTTTPATPSDSTPEIVRSSGNDGTDPSAPSAGSSPEQATISTVPLSAPMWADEGSGSSGDRLPMNGSGSGSSSAFEPTTPPIPRSKRRGTSPRSASPSDPATNAEAPRTSSGTTTTTRSRWTCDACAVLVTQGFTPDGTCTGAEASHGVPADRLEHPTHLILPKADRADREPVLRPDGHEAGKRFSTHPTMKPTDLMRHLIRLVTPAGGTVLDPFLGSGSTALACELEGFPWIGIEKEPEYVAIAEARLNGTQRGLGLDVGALTKAPPKTHPDLSKHQPKRRAPSENYTGGWTGTDEEPAA